MTTVYYTASSVDGFIADADNSLSWLLSRDVDGSGPMGYDPFFAGVGALCMGATTYLWLREHEQGWPYDQPCWVFTTRDLAPPEGADVRMTRADVAEVHAQMVAAAGDRDVWVVGGGELAAQFADRGLLDELRVQYAPVALGGGAPRLPRRVELRLEEVERNRDFACARYTVVR